jgi:hypothetical protein
MKPFKWIPLIACLGIFVSAHKEHTSEVSSAEPSMNSSPVSMDEQEPILAPLPSKLNQPIDIPPEDDANLIDDLQDNETDSSDPTTTDESLNRFLDFIDTTVRPGPDNSQKIDKTFTPTPGVLLNVTFRSVVATLVSKRVQLDTLLPEYLHDLIVHGLRNSPEGYWENKAKDQIRLMIHRQVQRRRYSNANGTVPPPGGSQGSANDGNVGQLPFPPEKVWDVTIDPEKKGPLVFERRRRTFVGIEYEFRSVVVARRGSLKRAEVVLLSSL